MITVGLTTGLRQGELLALGWEDVDLVMGRLLVRRAVARGRHAEERQVAYCCSTLLRLTTG